MSNINTLMHDSAHGCSLTSVIPVGQFRMVTTYSTMTEVFAVPKETANHTKADARAICG